MAELKKCPFCGSDAHLTKKNRIIVDGKTERECHVHCTVCNARAERVLYKACATTEMAHEIAIGFWNTRVITEAEIRAKVLKRVQTTFRNTYETMVANKMENCINWADMLDSMVAEQLKERE